MSNLRINTLILALLICLACRSQVSKTWELADASKSAGEYEQAIKLYTSMLDMLPDDDVTRRIVAFNGRAYCNKQLERYMQSLADYDNAIALANNDELNTLKINKSDLLIKLGQYEDAEKTLISVLSTDDTVNLYKTANLSTIYQCTERHDKCITLLDSIISVSSNNNLKSIAYQNRGYAYMSKDFPDYKSAISDFNRALALLIGSDYYITLSNKAVAEMFDMQYSSALSDISSVLSFVKQTLGVSHPEFARVIRKRAEILTRSKKMFLADKEFKLYHKLERDWIIDNLQHMSPGIRLNYWAKEKPLLSKCFLLEDYDAEFLFEVAMFRRQTSLLGMHDIDNLKKLLCVTPTQVRSVLKMNEAAVEFVTYEPEHNKTVYAAIVLPKMGKAKFVRLFDESDIYSKQSGKNVSLFEAIKQDTRKNKDDLYTDSIWGNRIWQPILSTLPQNASKIYFAPEGIFHLLGIENLPFVGKDGKEFHRVTSIASLTNKSISKRSKQKSMLVIGGLDYDESNILDADTTIMANREAADYLCKFTNGMSGKFTYLSGARAEVDTICAIVPQNTLKYEVGESGLKTLLPKFNVVHIATHGYCLDVGIHKRPEYLLDSIPYDKSLVASGLALSGVNRAMTRNFGEDEILSARELCDLDLNNVDFVVLSACETAKGNISDEGAAGIVRGLKNAGVKTILASLWSVDDKSTALFMQEFYKQINADKSRYEAFIAAQEYLHNYHKEIEYHRFSPKTLTIDRKGKKVTISYNSPYYWAPFILIDEY